MRSSEALKDPNPGCWDLYIIPLHLMMTELLQIKGLSYKLRRTEDKTGVSELKRILKNLMADSQY